MDRVFLSDGTVIKDGRDAVEFLNQLGIDHDGDFLALYYMLRDIIGVDDDVCAAQDKADEYELIADEYKQNMDGLCDEVRAIAEKLISEKRGPNYTKVYLGGALLRAVDQYEI